MQHILFILGGLTVVMGVLTLLWGVMALVGRAFAARTPVPQVSAPAPAPMPESAPAGVPPHHLAAIAAAVAVMTDGRGRVVRVTAAPHQSAAWAQHGRAELFASHRVRTNWKGPEVRS
ncbi:OadG family transporter subunit [Azospirillum sp.]|uniref:OadG family transporter subunit n=1 Tax=Azospirillum sp. TaxID=34012 RepID=UPI003D70FEB5